MCKIISESIFPPENQDRKYRRKKLYKKEKVHNFKTLHEQFLVIVISKCIYL